MIAAASAVPSANIIGQESRRETSQDPGANEGNIEPSEMVTVAIEGTGKQDEGSNDVEKAAFVARSEITGENLSFDELHERVKVNDLVGITFDADKLAAHQKEALVVRSTPLRLVLRRFAEVLESIAVSPEDVEFNMSQQCDQIDYFLSHAWRTKRWMKLIALLYYHNFRVACAVNMCSAGIMLAMCIMIKHEVFGLVLSTMQFKVFSFIALLVVPPVSFAVFLYFGTALPCRPKPNIFLDKLCIHQNNPDLKLLGINSLEVFVQKSRKLVVLCDANTYSRMWCAYEAAMFVRGSTDKTQNLHMVPVCASLFAVGVTSFTMVCIPLWCVLYEIFPTEPATAMWQMCTNSAFIWSILGMTGYASACYVPLGYLVQRCIGDMAQLSDTLRNFDTATTNCVDENDKGVLIKRIVEIWGSLKSFNAFVRGPVTESIAMAIGGNNFTPFFDIYAKTCTFFCGFAWMALNSPGTDLTENLLAGTFFAVPLTILCTYLWFRVACLMYSLFPTKPVLCWLATSVLMTCTCALSAYNHSTLWYLAQSLAEKLEIGILGGTALFMPVVALELYVLSRHHAVRKSKTMHLHTWNKFDTKHYAVVITSFFFLIGSTNLLSILNGGKDILSIMDGIGSWA